MKNTIETKATKEIETADKAILTRYKMRKVYFTLLEETRDSINDLVTKITENPVHALEFEYGYELAALTLKKYSVMRIIEMLGKEDWSKEKLIQILNHQIRDFQIRLCGCDTDSAFIAESNARSGISQLQMLQAKDVQWCYHTYQNVVAELSK